MTELAAILVVHCGGGSGVEPTVFATWEAHFKECRLVHQFLKEGVQRAANASTDDFYGTLLRPASSCFSPALRPTG